MIFDSKPLLTVFLLLSFCWSQGQSLPSFELTSEWREKIKSTVKEQMKTPTNDKKKLLIFSLYTGFNHWIIPHTEAVMKMIAQNSNAFEITISRDISVFEKDQLSKFDVVLLNNNCSDGSQRDLFWDIFNKDNSLNEQQKIKKANKLEKNLIRFVRKGKGLVVLHGGIVMQNNSLEFSEMVGGSFDYHPPQQEVHVKLVDPNHPLVNSFEPEGFIHYDEPYFFKNTYYKLNFRPLLYLEMDKIKMKRPRPNDKIKYISWIKRHGKGRVFYSSPSHNAQSYESPELLKFLYKGLLYASGFIDCDDSAIKKL